MSSFFIPQDYVVNTMETVSFTFNGRNGVPSIVLTPDGGVSLEGTVDECAQLFWDTVALYGFGYCQRNAELEKKIEELQLKEKAAEVVAALPGPEDGHGDVWLEIIHSIPDGWFKDLCVARRAMGMARYGQPLRYDDGRDSLTDLLQELLDAIVYARKAAVETQLPNGLFNEITKVTLDVAEFMRGRDAAC